MSAALSRATGRCFGFAHVAEREIGVDGSIREQYLVTAFDTDDESQHLTDVCWPVFQTHASG